MRFGVVSDVHKDVIHDADDRLRAFVGAMNEVRPDFIVQLGDLCQPFARNRGFLDIWRGFSGPAFHVLGNHDMDGGAKREDTVLYYGMPARYYSWDTSGIHFVALDTNDPGPGQQPYYHYVGDEQLEWLRADLEAIALPVVVFSHYVLDRAGGGVENHEAVRAVFEEASARLGGGKVIATFSGHCHRDYCVRVGGIIYSQINSAAYYWLGDDHPHIRYSAEVDKQYPDIKYTVPYREPLFGVVTIDPAEGYLAIEGRASEFVGPDPWETGLPRSGVLDREIAPRISDWRIPL